MKIKNPFKMIGSLEIKAYYKIANRMHYFDLSSKGNATNKQKLEWDSFKTIETFFAVEYSLIEPSSTPKEGEGKFGFSADWDASFSDKGVELSQVGVQPVNWGPQSSDGDVAVAASVKLGQSKLRDKTPFVQMVVDIVAGYTSEGFSIGLRAGPVSGSISMGGSKGGGKDQMEIKLILDMEQPAVKEKFEAAKIPPSLATSPAFIFEEDEDTLSGAGLSVLGGWIDKLRDHEQVRTVVLLGDLTLTIEGHASTTGPPDKKKKEKYNKDLALRRIDEVIRILRKEFGNASKMKFDKKPYGDSLAEGEGKKYHHNRRAAITFDINSAKKAIERLFSH